MSAADTGFDESFYSYDDSLISSGGGVDMATSTVDLSTLQTINFGGGQFGKYDPSSGTYYDSGGNALSASDLAQYGAFTVGDGTSPSPPSLGGGSSGPTINASGSGGALSGLGGLFSAVTQGITSAMRPQTITPPGGGTLVYNPATGGYTTPAALTAQSSMSPLIFLLLGGLVIYLIVKG